MASIPFIGKCFPTAREFIAYLETVKFDAWRPRFIVMHHTGSPTLKNWLTWQGRVTDEQWMKNLASYYGNNLGWSSGPQFFITPKNFCVLSLPNRRGVHAAAFNSASWGVEVVGNFDVELFEGPIKTRAIEGIACLHLAAGLTPEFSKNVRGLHFHRDDPTTSKTCPGTKVLREPMIGAVKAVMSKLSEGDDPDDEVVADDKTKDAPVGGPKPTPQGVVTAPDGLNLRTEASARSPAVILIPKSTRVAIIGEAMNGETKWLKVWLRLNGKALSGWVSAQFVKRD
jgi:hypothetical protein